MRKFWHSRRTDVLVGTFLTILPTLFYPLAVIGHGVFYVGDIFRLYYPQRALYADALRHIRLPLWTPDVLAGFPLFAEGQTGALYPPNLLLYRLLPIDLALNYSILLALALAGIAMYTLGRTLRLTSGAALLAALTFTYGGFFVGHFNHLNIMGAVPWLPLELAIIEKAVGATSNRYAPLSVEPGPRDTWSPPVTTVTLGLIIGVQFLAGHPQIWLMSTLVTLMFGVFRSIWPAAGPRRPMLRAVRRLAPIMIATAVGLALAAIQLMPTWELARQSVRAGGLSADFLTSFSWHPALLTTLVVPFILGNPYPNVSVELAAYLGVVPLFLALGAPFLRRDRLSAFLIGLSSISLVLAFGDHTPLYALLARIPVVNLFRVPARFLYPFTLAIGLLAGCGLDVLVTRYLEARPQRSSALSSHDPDVATTSIRPPTQTYHVDLRGLTRRQCANVPATVLVAGVITSTVGIRAASLDTLLSLRWVLPAITLATAGGLLLLAWQRRVGRRSVAWAAISLTLIDLYAFGAVYRLTYNDLMPIDQFYDKPASLSFFPEDTYNYRTLTHEAIVPALSVMRASLYPNISLLHSIPSANGYFPLLPERHAQYLSNLTPGRLNLLNTRYFLIPQLLPVDPETERYDVHNPFTPDLVGRTVNIPPTPAESLKLVSFTSQSADWPQSELVAEIVLTSSDGSTVRLPVRAGQETAEWAYDRSDVAKQIAHDRPPVTQTWPARSGFPPQEHLGHAYLARYQLPSAMKVSQIQVIPARPAGLFHIEKMTLIAQNQQHSLADLLGRGHHRLAYRDPDVVIYENRDALPRAFVAGRARVVTDDQKALSIIDSPEFDSRAVVLLNTSRPAGEHPNGNAPQPGEANHPTVRIVHYSARQVEIRVELDQPGYLVLLDSFYPGWYATVDGRPATIHRANVLFRAVGLEAGRHLVTFVYAPWSFKAGAVISLMALISMATAMAWTILRWILSNPVTTRRLGP